jgi:ATP-dependent RNA helicase DOB1
MVLDTIIEISSVRLNLPDDLTRQENKILVKETMKEVLKSFSGELPMIDPLKDMQINDDSLSKFCDKMKKLTDNKTNIEE